MEREQATQLVRLLADAFVKQLEPGTVEIYIATFEALKSKHLAYETVKDLIETSEHFPRIATIRSTYIAKRNRELDGEQNKQIMAAVDAEVVREIPQDFKDLMAAMNARSADANTFKPDGLEEIEGGECFDCKRNVEVRYVYGSFNLCSVDVAKRMALRQKEVK